MFFGKDLEEMVALLKETIQSVDNVSSSIGGVSARLDSVVRLLEGVNKRLDVLLGLCTALIVIACSAAVINILIKTLSGRDSR